MERNTIINKSQFGLKKVISTSDALTDLTGTIASNKMKYCSVIYRSKESIRLHQS